jgi:hypothetical protein
VTKEAIQVFAPLAKKVKFKRLKAMLGQKPMKHLNFDAIMVKFKVVV